MEDEFIVREGIKNNIDWVGEGLSFVGKQLTENGLSAHSIEPDIIITDINAIYE